MKQTDMASDVLTEYAEILRSELSTGDDDKLNDYTQVMDIMIFAVLLPQDLSEEMLLTKVQNDQYLDQPTKEVSCFLHQLLYQSVKADTLL
jgi:hypothetical protein